LNALLARAQQACCDVVKASLPGMVSADSPEHLFLEMFLEEWRVERGDAPLGTIAIVDTDPERQYLYPEFVLFRQLFERHGIAALITSPEQLIFREGALWHRGAQDRRIDLVYNRLTDFTLEALPHPLEGCLPCQRRGGDPASACPCALCRQAQLVALSDSELLSRWGVDAVTRKLLQEGIPRTEEVDEARAPDFWARRRQLFFKPAAGYGSKAAYRGDKLTRRVFEEILTAGGHYVAQALVQPSSRRLAVDGAMVAMKIDLRNYVYEGRVQLVTARLWQGQTTNFRTPGGGFAPVLALPT